MRYVPERPTEPPEYRIATSCCMCGEVICEGDGYFRIDWEDYCEECGKEWLDEHWLVAKVED